MVEAEEPQVGQLHDSKSGLTVHFYYPRKYYPHRSKRDDYSHKIVLSKENDLSEFFWPYVKKALEHAQKHWNEIFDCSCVIPNSKGHFSPTLLGLQKMIEAEYKIEPVNVLKKKADCKKQTTLSDAYDREQNARASSEVDEDERIGGSSILLIDDVKTSGSSIRAYTTLLHSKGAQSVAAIVLGENDPG